MNLYLISQTENQDYDTYDAAVVAAETIDEAQKTHPSAIKDWIARTWASSPHQVRVELIGKAKDGTKAGVILASFNAG
jgi:hypothetical protein